MEGLRLIPLGFLLIQPIFDQKWGHMVSKMGSENQAIQIGNEGSFPRTVLMSQVCENQSRHCA